jgi:putative flippase GtrA
VSTRTLAASFPRYVVAGGLCAVLNNVAVISLVHYGFGSVSASVVAFGPVLLVGYALHSVFTFATRPTSLMFGRYTLAMLSNFPLWAALLYVFCDLLRVSVVVVAPAATVLIFLWNYHVASKWAFLSRPVPAMRRESTERQM